MNDAPSTTRIAYLILAHKEPAQVARLVRALDAPANSFVIHYDKKSPQCEYDELRRSLAGMPNVRWVANRAAVHWGAYGMIEATFRMMDELASSRIAYDFAALVSGQHYPIVSNRAIAAELARDPEAIWVDFVTIPTRERWAEIQGGMQRIQRTYITIAGRQIDAQARFRQVAGAVERRLPTMLPAVHLAYRVARPLVRRIFLAPFPKGLKPFGGSQWWIMPRSALDRIRELRRERADIVRFFRDTMVPDEALFQTLVMNSDLAPHARGRNLNFYRWGPPDLAHPKILTAQDIPVMQASGALFARKFDMRADRAVLDQIDAQLRSNEPL